MDSGPFGGPRNNIAQAIGWTVYMESIEIYLPEKNNFLLEDDICGSCYNCVPAAGSVNVGRVSLSPVSPPIILSAFSQHQLHS